MRSWSPDGRYLTYHVEKYRVGRRAGHLPNARRVYVARADGSRRRLVGRGHSPAWSPDGREVVFLLNDDQIGRDAGLYTDEYGPSPPRTRCSGRCW